MSLPKKLPKSATKKNRRIFNNRYKVERRLGSGTCGTVWLVEDTKCKKEDEKLKVLKEIACPILDADETLDIASEATLLKNLNHPGIVHFHDAFLENEYYCIVTEYCEGGDLDQKIKEYNRDGKRFPEAIVVEYLIQLLLAVSYMHSRKVMHRDLKTRNVFIHRGKLKIGDFGISRIMMGTCDMASTFAGTPYYMSPEVLKHTGYNAKSDVWSIGCMLYDMVALKHAFDGESLMGVMYKIVEGDLPPWPSDYSEDLHNVFNIILNKDPQKRPSAMELLKLEFINKKMSMIKDTLIQVSNKKRRNSLEKEQEMLDKELKKQIKYGDLRKESESKKYKNLPPRERLRLKKMQKADEEAQRFKDVLTQQHKETLEQTNKIRQKQNPYQSQIFNNGNKNTTNVVEYPERNPPRYSYDLPKTEESDESTESDSEFQTANQQFFLTEPPIYPIKYNDDRPITPMKNTMIYSKHSSLDFKDGIPDKPELADTFYSQYDEFDKDSSDDSDEGTLLQTIVKPLSQGVKEEEDLIDVLEKALDFSDTMQGNTLLADDGGAFGPVARNQKIKNIRLECIKKFGQPLFDQIYNYLKKARGYGGDAKTTEEKVIMDNLSRLSPKNTSDCFQIDQLLFLEAQANLN